jgi:hypothetical protein
MLGFVENEGNDARNEIIFLKPNYNRMWGVDYLLMDSKTFMGGIGGGDYDEVIDMYNKIWNVRSYSLLFSFDNVHL